MKARLEIAAVEKPTPRVGDIVVSNSGKLYLVMKTDKAYVAKAFDGIGGLSGVHSTLVGLISSLPEDITICKQEDFELVLKKK